MDLKKNDIFPVNRDHQVGIDESYKKLLTHTVKIILTASDIDIASNLKIQISDGLDGSGSNRVYQQATHPEISTKSFILFGFKVISISDIENKLIWKNPLPNFLSQSSAYIFNSFARFHRKFFCL